MNKKLHLRKVVLLENESNMDLSCNPDFVGDIKKLKKPLMIQSNVGDMSINNKSKKHGYNKKVWSSRIAVTKIIAIKK